MKVGIVGVGQVGRAWPAAPVARGCARRIVLVARTRARAEAVATDIRYGLPLLPRAEISAGDYDDLAGSALVMITATSRATSDTLRPGSKLSATRRPFVSASQRRRRPVPVMTSMRRSVS